MPSDFRQFFRTATGHAPYAYQCRLACGEGTNLDDDSTRLRNVESGDCEFHRRSAINHQPTLASPSRLTDAHDYALSL